MYCTNCGTKRTEGDIYCTNCGKHLGSGYKDNFTTNASTSTKHTIEIINIILGIFALLFITIPVLSLTLAIISIVLSNQLPKEKNKRHIGTVLGVIGIVLSIGYIASFALTSLAIQSIEMETYEESFIEEFYKEAESNLESFEISGYSWAADDNSVLYLKKDKSYIWYEKEEVQTDNFYEGKYEYYTAEEAINYITNYLPQFGVTEEEQKSLFENSTYQEQDYYLIILECNKWLKNGQELSPETQILYYYGFYSEQQKRLDLINMNTKSSIGLTLKEKIISIDI